MAAKKRSTSALQGSDVESFQACLPLAMESAQSNRSPMCARICAGVRVLSPMWKVAKPSGAPRKAFPPRYATVARVWRRTWRAGSGDAAAGDEAIGLFPSVPRFGNKSFNILGTESTEGRGKENYFLV